MPCLKVILNTDIWNTSQVQRSKRGINFTTPSRLPLLYNVIFFLCSPPFIAPLFVQLVSINFRRWWKKGVFSSSPLFFQNRFPKEYYFPLFVPCLAGTNLPQVSSDTLISVIANILFKIYLWNTTRELSINQCFLKMNQMIPWYLHFCDCQHFI